jgi:hypothetical protein
MACQDGGSVVEVVAGPLVLVVVVVVVVVVELVVGRTRVQSVSAQCVSPVSIVRVIRAVPTQRLGRTTRQVRVLRATRSRQQTTLPGRPQVDWARSRRQRARSVPPSTVLATMLRTQRR